MFLKKLSTVIGKKKNIFNKLSNLPNIIFEIANPGYVISLKIACLWNQDDNLSGEERE